MRDLHSAEVKYKTILSSAFQTRNQYKMARAEAGLVYTSSKTVVIDGMTPNEIIEKLKEHGITISRSTLLNYEKWGLIPEAKRGGAGRGKGRTSDYPDETFAEAYAAYELMHFYYRLRPKELREVREMALMVENDFFNCYQGDRPNNFWAIFRNARDWLEIRIKNELNISLEEKIIIIYTIHEKKGVVNKKVIRNANILNYAEIIDLINKEWCDIDLGLGADEECVPPMAMPDLDYIFTGGYISTCLFERNKLSYPVGLIFFPIVLKSLKEKRWEKMKEDITRTNQDSSI